MHIALISTEYVTEANYDGGLANYLYRLAHALMQFGHEATIITLSNRAEETKEDGIRIRRVPLILPKWLTTLNLLTLQRFSELIHLSRLGWLLNQSLRSLHQRSPVAIAQYPQLAGISLFHPREIPAVIRLSSYTPIWRKKGGYDRKSIFRMWQQELLERLALKKADAIFSPSQVMADAVNTRFNRPVTVIENPFYQETISWDISLYEKQLAGKSYLLFFGRLNALKGVAVIAKILSPLLGNHPDLFFVFAGKDSELYQGIPMREYLKRKAGENTERILCLGRIPHKILYPVIKGSLAVVLPSLIDNLPNTCLEAMEMQKVVVGTFGTSFDQLILDGKSGFLCRPNDPQDLLQTLEKILTMSPVARSEMGRKAGERIETLKPEKIIPRLISWYEDVINKKAKMNKS